MRQRDVPRELQIGDSFWTIKFVRCIEGDLNTLGLCDPSEYTIYIKQGQNYEERLNTVLHEITHAISYEYGFYEALKHAHVYKLAEGFTQIFLDGFM